MLKPINPISNRVADGRRFAARSIVITSLSALSCFVFRRRILPVVEGESRDESIYPGGHVLSNFDEHAVEYDEQGHAMLLFDKLPGGSMHSDGDSINIGEAMFYAQIEPFHFSDYGQRQNMLKNIPDWKPKKGDILAMVVSEDLIKWVEIVGVTGQTLHAHHGDKYVLNVRDRLEHLEPFITQESLLVPESNPFPMPLSQLLYQDAPLYEFEENDPTTKADDEVKTKLFKLVNFTDPQLQNYPSIMSIVHLNKRTNSHYYFGQEDQERIVVDVRNPETYILTSDVPVKAIETPSGHISYVAVVIDRPSMVSQIEGELSALRAVQVKDGEKIIFEIMPMHFDELRKAYHFICTLVLGQAVQYDLVFESGEIHRLELDATGLGVA
ncbi:hypothetical protein [Acinetobacter indicus]|uniref:hypothetical protein n=1 Tax=Acinetobacter indicus TaxID=756892 RepID=UPI00209B4FCC|nr:hypothetical protein [Acinetobacter indicus]MCO8088180.1 hypothetical protein [Acinetobacter indicus]